MDKVGYVGSEVRLIKYLIVIICLLELFNMLLYCTRYVYFCNEKGLKMKQCNLSVEIFPSN